MIRKIERLFSIIVSSLVLLLVLASAVAVAGVVSERIPNGLKLKPKEVSRTRFHRISPTESVGWDTIGWDTIPSMDSQRSASPR